jgi:hypothetical protein
MEVIRILRDIDYKGCFNFEPRGTDPPEAMMRKCRVVYDKLMDIAWPD